MSYNKNEIFWWSSYFLSHYLKWNYSSISWCVLTLIKQPSYYAFLFLELIPRPARSCEDPPLYLRLRMGKPINKPIPRSTPLMSYGKKKMRPEYWFSVPKNRVDELYNFLNVWVPHLYGELSEKQVNEYYVEKIKCIYFLTLAKSRILTTKHTYTFKINNSCIHTASKHTQSSR